jgi:hypothetical protein
MSRKSKSSVEQASRRREKVIWALGDKDEPIDGVWTPSELLEQFLGCDAAEITAAGVIVSYSPRFHARHAHHLFHIFLRKLHGISEVVEPALGHARNDSAKLRWN